VKEKKESNKEKNSSVYGITNKEAKAQTQRKKEEEKKFMQDG